MCHELIMYTFHLQVSIYQVSKYVSRRYCYFIFHFALRLCPIPIQNNPFPPQQETFAIRSFYVTRKKRSSLVSHSFSTGTFTKHRQRI